MKYTSTRKAKVDKIYFALPAIGYEEISKKTGLSYTDVGDTIGFVRRYGKALGWTIPHAPRGKTTDELKLHCSLITANGEFETDPVASDAVRNGELGSLRLWATQCENQSIALTSFSKNHETDPYKQKLLRSLARGAKNMAEEARELIELMKAA